MRALVIASVAALFACGGSADDASLDPTSSAVLTGAGAPGEKTGSAAGPGRQAQVRNAHENGPEWTFTATQVPDPCTLLTAEDAREVFGVPTRPGQSAPAGNYNCQYFSEDGPLLLVLDMSIWQDWREHLGVQQQIDYCGGEPVAELESPGRRAVLFDIDDDGACGAVDIFWVSTGVYFQGAGEELWRERMGEDGKLVEGPLAGYIHFTLSLSLEPAPEQDVLVEKLSTVAQRTMARLPR